jgi:hypothetical protein
VEPPVLPPTGSSSLQPAHVMAPHTQSAAKHRRSFITPSPAHRSTRRFPLASRDGFGLCRAGSREKTCRAVLPRCSAPRRARLSGVARVFGASRTLRQVSWLPDRPPAGPSQAPGPVDLPAFVPGYSGGGRTGFSPASLARPGWWSGASGRNVTGSSHGDPMAPPLARPLQRGPGSRGAREAWSSTNRPT